MHMRVKSRGRGIWALVRERAQVIELALSPRLLYHHVVARFDQSLQADAVILQSLV